MSPPSLIISRSNILVSFALVLFVFKPITSFYTCIAFPRLPSYLNVKYANINSLASIVQQQIAQDSICFKKALCLPYD